MSCPDRPFEEVEHTADLRLLVRGETLEDLFEHAAQGVFHLMRPEPGATQEPVSHLVSLDSFDLQSLLVDWLNELVYLSERDGEVYSSYEIVHLEPTHLEAAVRGANHYRFRKAIKAATFSDLAIEATPLGLEATITFDV